MCEKIHAIDGMGNFVFLSILLVDDYHDRQVCAVSRQPGFRLTLYNPVNFNYCKSKFTQYHLIPFDNTNTQCQFLTILLQVNSQIQIFKFIS